MISHRVLPTQEMLEQLWSNLKPNVRRSGGRITKEWGEIGFQGTVCADAYGAFDAVVADPLCAMCCLYEESGTDPMSDFRGMGILSLHQLIHFSSKYPVEAQA